MTGDERNEEAAMWEARFYSMAADFYMLFMTRPQLISDEDRRIFGGTVTETLRHHIDKREKEAGR